MSALNEAGVPCGVLVAPILPGITDHPSQLRDVVRAAIDAGATHVSPILLHLRPRVREEYMGWLAENYPDLVPRYEEMYARSPYASMGERRMLGRRVARIVRQAGGIKERAPVAERFRRTRAADGPGRAKDGPGETSTDARANGAKQLRLDLRASGR